MSPARSVLFCLALAQCVYLAPLPAAAQAQLSPVDIQKRIEDETGIARIGERVIDLAPLKEFYRQRGFKLAWGANGDKLVAEMQRLALAEGLSAEAYALPAAASEFERDLALSDSVARFGRDLAIGRVTPTRPVGGMGPETRPGFDSVRFLRDIAAGKEPASLVPVLPPPYAGYQRLKLAMEKYREVAKAGGWNVIPDGPSIKPGMEDERVPALRKRLIASGELEARYDKGKALDSHVQAAVRKFQTRHGIEPDGAVGKQTLTELNVSAEDRLKQIMVNLERWRWMPRSLDATHVAVNLPAAHLELVRDGEIKMSMRVVVGDVEHQTPSMQTTMNAVVLNPTWTVPPSIATKEILPKLRKDPNYLAANNMRILEAFPEDSAKASGIGIDWRSLGGKFPWRIRQKPGPDNALGQVKFNLSNTDDIYLHDTPKRQYFGRIFRALSHGCVRVERPIELAEAILGGDYAGKVNEIIAGSVTKTIKLDKPLTVYLMYMTAWADEDGTMNFRSDLYGHDGRLKAALKRPIKVSQPQVAQEKAQGSL